MSARRYVIVIETIVFGFHWTADSSASACVNIGNCYTFTTSLKQQQSRDLIIIE